jgi:inosine/xanthosine triphosphate pyrophosphatase family protein
MIQKETSSNEDKINEIKAIYNRALIDIDKIKKERDEKIKNLMYKIDKKSVDSVLQDIKNLK